MATKTENIAAGTVMPLYEGKPPDPLYVHLLRFHTSIAALQRMIKIGILTDSDLQKCRDILAEKYGLSLCSIFR